MQIRLLVKKNEEKANNDVLTILFLLGKLQLLLRIQNYNTIITLHISPLVSSKSVCLSFWLFQRLMFITFLVIKPELHLPSIAALLHEQIGKEQI